MRHFAAPLAFLALAACQPEPVIPGKLDTTGEVLSTVNNVNVTQGTLDAILAAMPAATRDQITASGQLAQFKERLVMEEILYQEAIKQKVHERPEVKTQLVLAEREALVSALVQDVVEKRLTDERLKAWYDEHKVQFARTQAHARHVLVKDEKDAKAIYEQLKAGGADFAAIAKEKSTDKGSGAEGGDLIRPRREEPLGNLGRVTLRLLQQHDVWLCGIEPGGNSLSAGAKAVDVPGGDTKGACGHGRPRC